MSKKDIKKTINNMISNDALIQIKEHKSVIFAFAPIKEEKQESKQVSLKLETYVLLSKLSKELQESVRKEIGLRKEEK